MKQKVKVLSVLLAAFILAAGIFSCSAPAEGERGKSSAEDTSETAGEDSAAEKEPLKIVCLGDSITAGVFELMPCDTYFNGYVYDVEAAYPALLEALVEERGYDVTLINSGISGNTVTDALRRLERDVIAHSPDIVTVCFGLNDAGYGDTTRYTDGLAEIFDTIRANNPDVKIVFMTPNMLADRVNEKTKGSQVNYSMALGNVHMTESGMLDVYMDAARAICAEKDVPVSDAYAHWKRLYEEGQDISELLASNVVHPTREMHPLFAGLILETLIENDYIK